LFEEFDGFVIAFTGEIESTVLVERIFVGGVDSVTEEKGYDCTCFGMVGD
jgi:hypothetical protein